MTEIKWPFVTLVLGLALILVCVDGYFIHTGELQATSFIPTLAAITSVVLSGALGHAQGFAKGLATMPPPPPGTEYRLVPSLSPPPADAMLKGEIRIPAQSPTNVVAITDLPDTSPETPASKKGVT